MRIFTVFAEALTPKTTYDVVIIGAIALISVCSLAYLTMSKLRARRLVRECLKRRQALMLDEESMSPIDRARLHEGADVIT